MQRTKRSAPPPRGSGAVADAVGAQRGPGAAADAAAVAKFPARASSTADRRADLWLGVGQILGSHVVLAIAGVSSLPVLARNFGPARYGDFSMFVTVLGIVTYQDFARQLMVHEQAKERASERDLDALARMSTIGLAALAIVCGALVLEPLSACVLLAAALLHGLASRDFAALSAGGRVGAATAVRNCAWSCAFACAAAASFASTEPLACTAPFAVANLGILIAYRRLAGNSKAASSAVKPAGSLAARISGWAHLRSSPELAYYKREAANLLGITIACSVLTSAERIVLMHTRTGSELGLYTANCDLAVKVNVLGTALSAALFPMLARAVHEHGFDVAARKFVRIASAAVLAGFVGIAALLAFDREIASLVLGPSFARGPDLLAPMLLGVFVQGFGFVCAPWQRALGDFRAQRRATTVAAVSMVAVAVALIPRYGITGALAAFLCARTAEASMAVCEARRLDRTLLPAWKLAAAAAMFVALAGFAGWRFASSI